MAGTASNKQFASFTDSGHEWRNNRHQPERALLYQTFEQYDPTFLQQLLQQGKSLPDYVHCEFAAQPQFTLYRVRAFP